MIEEILVAEDETVEIGAILARIGDGSGAAAGSGRRGRTAAEAAPAEARAPEAEPAPAAEAAAPAASSDATEVRLPELGESVTEGTVTRWLKQVGDDVAVDEPLLEISTDKVDTEIPSPVAGTLQEILAAEDETIAVGAVLARIGSGAPAPAQRLRPPRAAPAAPAQPAPAPGRGARAGRSGPAAAAPQAAPALACPGTCTVRSPGRGHRVGLALRDAAGAPPRRREGRRPGLRHRNRRRRAHPQGGRPERRAAPLPAPLGSRRRRRAQEGP